MNRYEYLRQLEEQLRGAVSNQELTESVQFYREYIEGEIRKGKSEEEVLEDLGSANSIAKSIIEAAGIDHEEEIVDEPGTDPSYGNQGSSTKVFRAEGWKGILIFAAIVFIVIFLVVFAFRVFIRLLPILIPAALIVYILNIFSRRRP